jgi:hypothetical protein
MTDDKPPEAEWADIEVLIDRVLSTQAEAAQRGRLCLWTIYDHPRDYPDHIVARRHEAPGGPTQNAIGGKLEFLREIFESAGLHRIDREPGDDASIIETWI